MNFHHFLSLVPLVFYFCLQQLYEALHVGEHQIRKERELYEKLEILNSKLGPLEKVIKANFQLRINFGFFCLIAQDERARRRNNLIKKFILIFACTFRSPSQKKMELDAKAGRKANALTWVGLGLMSVQFGVLARLTWWEYSWDVSSVLFR